MMNVQALSSSCHEELFFFIHVPPSRKVSQQEYANMVKSCVLQFPCEMPLRMSTQNHTRPMAQNHLAPISAIVNGNPVLQSRVMLQPESSLFSLSACHPRPVLQGLI